MEEKEIKFKIKKDDEYIEVSSNVENNLDYIESEEIQLLITELLNYEIQKETKTTLIENVKETGEELDQEKFLECTDIINERVANFTGDLIHLILNYVHNQDSVMSKELRNKLDYSLIVYGPMPNKKQREVYETFHYQNVNEDEKILGCLAMCKDIVDILVKNNNSKEKVKQAFNQVIAAMWLNIYKYIDKSNM